MYIGYGFIPPTRKGALLMSHEKHIGIPYIDFHVLFPAHQGKVRETYIHSPERLIQVASDRISTHDVVHHSHIPHKGEVLTILTIFWLTNILETLPNHLIAWGRGVEAYFPSEVIDQYPDLRYRTLVVQNLEMIPVEFILRRYLTGSALKHYRADEDPYGLVLPPGLAQMTRFEEPQFTPTKKLERENDPPLRSTHIAAKYPKVLKLIARAFDLVEQHLVERTVSLVDTKLEIGVATGDKVHILADEVFTPDSSRYVYTADIQEGVEPTWLDKQVVRNEVEHLCAGGPIVPCTFSEEVIEQTGCQYLALLELITGKTLQEWHSFLDIAHPVV